MPHSSPRVFILSGYRMTSQMVCEAISKSLDASIGLYRIPRSQWLGWLWYRLKRYGILTLLGHIGLSLYLRLRSRLLRLNRQARDITSQHKLPEGVLSIQSQDALLDKISQADVIVMIEPFRLPRSVYSSKSTIFLEVVWGRVPFYVGDSAGWWEKVIEDGANTCVSLVQRSGEASDLTLLASWEVKLRASDTIGRVRLRQAEVLARQLPEFLKNHIASPAIINKKQSIKTDGFSYISPTLWEYLRFNKVKVVPQTVINRRRNRITYKLRSYEQQK